MRGSPVNLSYTASEGKSVLYILAEQLLTLADSLSISCDNLSVLGSR